jgi:AraC-like DNA-binding protein
MMDPLAGLLDGPRARSAFVLRSSFDPPWCLRIEDEAPLTIVAVVRGGAWIKTDSSAEGRLGTGDVAVLRGPEGYLVADDPSTPPHVRIGPGQVCTAPDGQQLTTMGPLGVRSWGNHADGATMLVTGTYQTAGELSRHLLAALPSLVVQPGTDWSNPLIAYLTQEAERDAPGQDAVLDRLLDVVLIAALRRWFADADTQKSGWYRAQGDRVVGPALALMYERPADPWTLASLAAAAGTSRAALARRFHDLVGEPPMAYLAGWRLALAADLLTGTDATLSAVARQVGYGSAFALSAAFKRVRGVSPREHRAAS